MDAPPPASVDEYIAAFPPEVQRTLQAVRRAVRRAVPEAVEGISHGIPAYWVRGRRRSFLGFGAYRGHWSIFGSTAGLLQAFGAELALHQDSGRGTLRFPLDAPVPEELVRRIAAFRAREVAAAAP